MASLESVVSLLKSLFASVSVLTVFEYFLTIENCKKKKKIQYFLTNCCRQNVCVCSKSYVEIVTSNVMVLDSWTSVGD